VEQHLTRPGGSFRKAESQTRSLLQMGVLGDLDSASSSTPDSWARQYSQKTKMRPSALLTLLITAAAATVVPPAVAHPAAASAAIAGTARAATALRWMPLGDSITDYGCWRALIWAWFHREGYDVDLVGGERAGEDCNGLPFDRDHEGVGVYVFFICRRIWSAHMTGVFCSLVFSSWVEVFKRHGSS